MKIRRLPILLLLLLLGSCHGSSDFLANCSCTKIDLSTSIDVDDNLNRFKIKFPTEQWEPYLHTNELGNGVVGVIFDGESFKAFGVTELIKVDDWKSRKEAQIDIESKYNVIEKGTTVINGMDSYWNLVDFDKDSIPSLTLYITTEHPSKDWFYTLNLSVSKDKYGKKELCELENLMYTFKTH